MKNKRTRILIISLCALFLLLIPVGVIIIGGNPPRAKTPEEITRDLVLSEREDCLKLLDEFKQETLDDSKSIDENARIAEKNALLQSYKDYFERNWKEGMTEEEYEVLSRHLQSIRTELNELEPPMKPEKKLYYWIGGCISTLEEDLCFRQAYKERYMENWELHIPMAKEAIEELSAIRDKLQNKSLDFDQAYSQCMSCMEYKVKLASPLKYDYCLKGLQGANFYHKHAYNDLLEAIKESQSLAALTTTTG